MQPVFLRRWAALALLVLSAALATPVPAQENGPTAPIAAETDAAQDAAIATRIREILDELGGYEDVSVRVSDGIVRLRGTVTSAEAQVELARLVSRVEGVVAIRDEVTETAELSRRLNPAIERFRTRAWQFVTFLPLLLISLAVFAAIAALGWWVARRTRLWSRLAPNAFVASLYSQLVMIAFVIAGIVVALDILNATALIGTILGAAGIVGLAVGFAVKDTVENYIASIMLSIRQPFRPNDLVEIEGDQGKVIRLTSRATILLSLDGNHIRIPNATVFKSRIVNYTLNAERRFMFEIGVASDADLAAIRALAIEVMTGLPFVLDTPGPNAWIDRIGDGAIFFTVLGWVSQRETDLMAARSEALRRVKEAIEAAGVEVPDTTYRIQVLGGGAATVEADTDRRPAPPRGAVPPARDPAARDPAPRPPPGPGDVSAGPEQDLERLVESERRQPETRDLLKEDADRME
ncbi:mechanosensitive ion channel family protein [Wenxinia saemankumensis]|uniref:Small-conductance mechanosensitive channel n=1 Tax=Wenxinia saemankumensis TaxID=1447782 RepID=A0A1M6DXS3_9RHOB|nr:mechanosensitive ion channel family protein [Wenxinia saemankumensis]SHI78087.1 Small-conductance mechanosensitive channel [Wenxinia saemankumensis]